MEDLLQDLRYAFRMIAKSPGVMALALVTIGVATGANATVFGFVSALLLRPAQGVQNPRSLVAIYTSDYSSGPYGNTSYPDFLSIRQDTSAFADLVAESTNPSGTVRIDERVDRLAVSQVTGGYFQLLGVRATAGRLLTTADTDAAAPPAAVIGHRFWLNELGGDPSIVGATLWTNGRSFTIVGVAGERFEGLNLAAATQVWTPLVPPLASPAERGNRGLEIVGRLRQGVSLTEAQAQIDMLAARLAAEFPDSNLGTLHARSSPRPMYVLRHSRMPPELKPIVQAISAILIGAVGLVLVIACANVAGVLVSRAIARDREMAVRLALGAGRRRILRQLLTESLLLGLGGGMCGLLFSLWTSDLLPSFFPAEQARLLDTSVDANTVVFIAVISTASSLLFGLAPALHASGTASSLSLRTTSGGGSDGRSSVPLRRILVGAQVAAAVVLLVSAGLLVRSLTKAVEADLGFGTRNGVTATVEVDALPEGVAREYYAATLDRVRGMKDVRAAAFAQSLPLSQSSRRLFRIDGYQPAPNEDMELVFNTVSEGYFETMQIKLRAGRTFTARDREGSIPVVIVNELLASRFFGGDALGKHITDSGNRRFEIVGVVQSHTYVTVQDPPVPIVFYPLAQEFQERMTLVARVDGNPSTLVEPVRRAMLVDPRVPIYRTMTLKSHFDEATATDRLTASLVAVCGGMALMLSTLGVYGVVAYALARRTREIGIRIALGARPPDVVRLILREGLIVTGAGTALGLVGAAVAARGLGSLLPLYGVGTMDPLTYVAAPVILAIVAVVAALPPTNRALRLDPNAVLRE